MLSYLVRRLLLAIPTLLGVLVVVFLLLYVAPGDPVQEMVGERADAATIARLRRALRPHEPLWVESARAGAAAPPLALLVQGPPLADPLWVQFASYAGQVVRGDLGRSYITGRPIL